MGDCFEDNFGDGYRDFDIHRSGGGTGRGHGMRAQGARRALAAPAADEAR